MHGEVRILLTENRMPSLLDRRAHMKLCTMYKIVNTLIDFPNAPVEFRTIPYSSRHLHPLTLLDHQSKTNSFSASFFPSTCKAWNNLNYDIVSISTFSSLKNLIKIFFFNFLFWCTPCVSMCILLLCVSVQLAKLL